MLKKFILAVTMLLMLKSVYVSADTGTIEVTGSHDYKSVRLTPEIYNKSNGDLSDIRILDENGNQIPYFINNFESETINSEKVYDMTFSNSFVKDSDTYEDYFIESLEKSDILATSISVNTDTPVFAKKIELRGSHDGVNWDFIQTDKLYRVDESEKLTITFEKPLKYTHYRFKIFDNAEKVTFNKVSLGYSQVTVDRLLFTEKINPSFDIRTNNENFTVIILFGLENIKIKDITIGTDSQFKRKVSVLGKAEILYNLSFKNDSYSDTTLELDGYLRHFGPLPLQIDNGDDAPINISDVTVTYLTDELIFKGQNGSIYTLSFGDSSIQSAPVYDIANYKDLILKEGYDSLDIENIEISVEEEEKTQDYTFLFNAVIIASACILGLIILLKLKS